MKKYRHGRYFRIEAKAFRRTEKLEFNKWRGADDIPSDIIKISWIANVSYFYALGVPVSKLVTEAEYQIKDQLK